MHPQASDFGGFAAPDGRVQQTYNSILASRCAGDAAGDTRGAMLKGWSLVAP